MIKPLQHINSNIDLLLLIYLENSSQVKPKFVFFIYLYKDISDDFKNKMLKYD